MSKEKQPTIVEQADKARENFQRELVNEQSSGDTLAQVFTSLETTLFQASREGVDSLEGTITDLIASGEAAKTAAETKGDLGVVGYFVGKLQTYQKMKETIAAKPIEKPTPTKTEEKSMSGAKSDI